jgi:hypothetical protein
MPFGVAFKDSLCDIEHKPVWSPYETRGKPDSGTWGFFCCVASQGSTG